MFGYLFQISNLYLFFLLCGISLSVTFLFILLVKHFVPLEVRYKENGVIGSMSAFIGIIYAVLVGITALYLTNNINFTGDAVQREANGAANFYRDTNWLKEPAKANLQQLLKTYIVEVIDVEWPLMAKGKKIKREGDTIIDKMGKELAQYGEVNSAEMLILHDMLDSLKDMYSGRQHRIQMSYAELNPEIWEVILIGTVLTIMINYLFGMNFALHIITAGAGALMAASMLFLLLSLDRPFQGDFVIRPDSLKSLLIDINAGVPPS